MTLVKVEDWKCITRAFSLLRVYNYYMNRFIYWSPRILSVLLIVFVSIFAFDVFEDPNWPIALIIHLIPSLVLIGATIVAWKNRRLGGYIFFLLGLFSLWFYHTLIIAGPVFVISALFLAGSFYKNKSK